MSRSIPTAVAALLLACAGCVDLDFTIHNGAVHCSRVGPDTCEGASDAWGRVCVPCDQPYDWDRDYPWVEGARARAPVGVEQLTLETYDGKGTLDAYFIPAHGENPELAQTTVLHFHGNYIGIEHYMPRVRFLHEAGFTVLTVDYRGYGKSQPDSVPTAEQFFDDAELAREALEAKGVNPDRVIYYGMSLGALPATELALRRAPCALFLEAPFPSVDLMCNESSLSSLPASFLTTGDYDNVRKLGALRAPLFLLHGEEDNAFSIKQSEKLYQAAAGPKRFWRIPGADHGVGKGVVETAGTAEYFDQMERFLDELAPGCLGR